MNLAETPSMKHNARMAEAETRVTQGVAAAAPQAEAIEIPGFTLRRVIGIGTMGVVHEAEQHCPPRPVAVKVMRVTTDAPQAERIRQEALAVSRCNHPSIVQVFASGVLHGTGIEVPWIAMERIDSAVSIDEWFRLHAPDLDSALRMFESLADAMQQAHLQGLLHRDLKPGNILVDRAGRPVVIDFGLAAIEGADSLTAPGTIVGTLRTMPPEVIAGGRADVRSDIFSLAVTMHECLAGAWPFGEMPTNLASLARTIDSGCGSYARGASRMIPGDLRWVLVRALETDPARRHQSMLSLGDDLRAVRARRPVSARRPSMMYRLRCWIQRSPLVAALVALLVTVVGAGTVVSARLGIDAAREFERANLFLEIWTAFMARQPVDQWPPRVTAREMVDGLTLRHMHERGFRAPDRMQLMRALALSRGFVELGEPGRARDLIADCRSLCDALDADAADRFEVDIVDLMIRGIEAPESPQVRAFADGLHARLAEITPWRQRAVDGIIMLHAGGPACWSCMERALMRNDPSDALMVAISLPHLARFPEGTPDRLQWASEATAGMLRRIRGPSTHLVRVALRRGAEGLVASGQERAARPMLEALAEVEGGS